MDRLSRQETEALHEALEDEYRAWATYNQVIVDFGPVRPFVNIRESEARHIEALMALFTRYGLTVPENTWVGRAQRYPDVEAACEAGVAAEIDNGAMYDRLLAVAGHTDIQAVFANLKDASQHRHLAAFQRCASRRHR